MPPGRLSLHLPGGICCGQLQTCWHGYKVHFSETCNDPDPTADERPNLNTNVMTTDATVNDSVMTTAIHERLDQRGLLSSIARQRQIRRWLLVPQTLRAVWRVTCFMQGRDAWWLC
ncbi:hypothetical protein [Dactylosporangium sp. NPDC050588]|uniref:hypothetical protein n=1 Tax=Dactylosporangium sp. NPDC050588 TaxID=3157211 RepID=UPI0033F02909